MTGCSILLLRQINNLKHTEWIMTTVKSIKEATQMTDKEMERRSSAVTLSDMEIFIFPELMYSLVLANIMSPRIWRWREEPWFQGIEKMNPYKRLLRLRQFIMDNYVFNLDLETWGLTSQKEQLARFEKFMPIEQITSSNALFGYQGDEYYFDIDIRTHFGLDKYDAETIPYWKTETVEAMDAFRHRPGFETGAGECVSLAALYAAALFVICRIPLNDIYMMATPLHSQSFVDVRDGILINNRRLVTKSMWFNGTQISGQARRALENEQVTIVSHATGWVHSLYKDATIAQERFQYFSDTLHTYLKTELTPDILGNFLRQNPACRRCFVIRWPVRGTQRYLLLTEAFDFESDSAFKVTGNTREKLMATIPVEHFAASYLPSKAVLNDIEEFVAEHSIDLDKPEDRAALQHAIGDNCVSAVKMVQELVAFCHTQPRLPDISQVKFDTSEPTVELRGDMSREQVIEYLQTLRASNVTVDMAFYTYRDFVTTSPEPFLKAAMERNPVCVEESSALTVEALLAQLASWPNESIYDGSVRLAQPDELWTFKRGDGLEKALAVACILKKRGLYDHLRVVVNNAEAELYHGSELICSFTSAKASCLSEWQLF